MKSFLLFFTLTASFYAVSQNIGDFTSVTPAPSTDQLVIPTSHRFQKIMEVGDVLTEGGNFPSKPDFTGYVPIANSSTNGYLSINSEDAPGGVTVLDINFNTRSKLWETTASQAINFSSVLITAANCSGTVTPWNTVISSEEVQYTSDFNGDNYYDLGWNVEIDPAGKTVLGKRWAMGNFAHENVTIHPNQRTVYQGADSNPGYLYRFVATNAQDLSDGKLYVYKGSKSGTGHWVLLNNTTAIERNTTLDQSGPQGVDATVFAGIEDVETGPDGMVYVAVKSENRVYRFQDSDPVDGASTVTMETFVGNTRYDIYDGNTTTSVNWGYGNDNLAFDGDGNLWVFQDGGTIDNNYIWVVKKGHTQAHPKVALFGIVPAGSEPTGITFTPDYHYLFMSIMHPDDGNTANQTDAANMPVSFSKGTALVIALNENLGTSPTDAGDTPDETIQLIPNPLDTAKRLHIKGKPIYNVKLYSLPGNLLLDRDYNGTDEAELRLSPLSSGLYLVKINDVQTSKLVVR